MTQTTSEVDPSEPSDRSDRSVELPPPGLYSGIPHETYLKWQAVSNSALNRIKEASPAALHEARFNPSDGTDEQAFGTAIHCAVLQPELFEKTYVVPGGCAGYTAKREPCGYEGKIRRGKRWFCKTHDPAPDLPIQRGLHHISQDRYDRCLRLRDGAMAHPLVRELLNQAELIEVSGVVQDPRGFMRKFRPDILCPSLGWVPDVKSTEDAAKRPFYASIRKWGYYRQGPVYLDSLRLLREQGIIKDDYSKFLLIAFAKSGVTVPVVYFLGQSEIEEGMLETNELLDEYGRCLRSGIWPGHGWNWDSEPAGYHIQELSKEMVYG